MGAIDAARAALTHSALVPLWRPLVSDLVVVLTLHRFGDRELGVTGTSVTDLRANLAFLRRHRFRVSSMNDLLSPSAPLRTGGPHVVFTVDDGYAEFANVAAPVFAEFDCPVTVFITTGPVDGGVWYWWDRVAFAIQRTKRTSFDIEVGGRSLQWSWQSAQERVVALNAIREALKDVPDDEKERVLAAMPERLDVAVPSAPPPEFAAMSWDDVRRCTKLGVTFGPHSVTHPILPHVDEARALREIRDSWQRLREKCDATVPVFAYPNGAHSAREFALLAKTDLRAAVTTWHRYAALNAFQSNESETRFAIPRFGYAGNPAQFVQIVTGVERLKMGLRRGRDGWRAVGA
jgi:peptidoglycan/xylan/chitin deacetylase (PgdA/CDA1 family)